MFLSKMRFEYPNYKNTINTPTDVQQVKLIPGSHHGRALSLATANQEHSHISWQAIERDSTLSHWGQVRLKCLSNTLAVPAYHTPVTCPFLPSFALLLPPLWGKLLHLHASLHLSVAALDWSLHSFPFSQGVSFSGSCALSSPSCSAAAMAFIARTLAAAQ